MQLVLLTHISPPLPEATVNSPGISLVFPSPSRGWMTEGWKPRSFILRWWRSGASVCSRTWLHSRSAIIAIKPGPGMSLGMTECNNRVSSPWALALSPAT